jgi:hypothetical protein
MKSMPLDMPVAPKSEKRDPEVTIRKMKGGFHIRCNPEKSDTYKDDEYVKETLEEALAVAKAHLAGGKKDDEKKD